MTQEEILVDEPFNYWFCGPRLPHTWMYRGKNIGYRCTTCGFMVTKAKLKEATDA